MNKDELNEFYNKLEPYLSRYNDNWIQIDLKIPKDINNTYILLSKKERKYIEKLFNTNKK